MGKTASKEEGDMKRQRQEATGGMEDEGQTGSTRCDVHTGLSDTMSNLFYITYE